MLGRSCDHAAVERVAPIPVLFDVDDDTANSGRVGEPDEAADDLDSKVASLNQKSRISNVHLSRRLSYRWKRNSVQFLLRVVALEEAKKRMAKLKEREL